MYYRGADIDGERKLYLEEKEMKNYCVFENVDMKRYIGEIDSIEKNSLNLKNEYQAKITLSNVSDFDIFLPKDNISIPEIEKVIFNDPATIVYWSDGTKTVVKKQKPDSKKKFDPEKGLAMAIAKKALGNTGRYFDTIKEWCE